MNPAPTSTRLVPVRPDRRRTARRAAAAATAAVIGAGLLQAPAAPAATTGGYAPPKPQPVPAVPVSPVPASSPAAGVVMREAAAKPAPVWPDAGTVVVDVPATGSAPARAGSLPVRAAAPAPSSRQAGGVPGRVRVQVLDRAATAGAGVRGVLLRVTRADGATGTGQVAISVDYEAFATAFGADWASRLRLVALPECALSTPGRVECAGSALPSTNDLAADTVSATVPADTDGLIAVTAAASGPAGDYTATSLQPSSTWSAGGNSGAFTWSYPMRTPPAPGGPAPQVALRYSSQSVDGRHAASNNQPSWMGEGFEAWPGGFIERRYRTCADDMGGSANNSTETGDLCWETDNATLSLNGTAGELIYNSSEGRWHLRSDDGSRIERRTGAVNGDNDGEYWVLTTTDGTQYWFGVNRLPGWASGDPVTDSTWTVPVFGNEPGEPCHATAFADSDCVQAWRWNLDYVVDSSGNSISYWYVKETNKYGRNLDPDDAAGYERAGWLDRIAYGTRQDAGVDSVLDTPAPAQVDLAVADRCLSDCATHDEAHWPDTPWDSECTAAPCTGLFSPTFWTTKRLASITTQVRDGSGYRDVERWTFTHTFPDPGDGTRAGLWLAKISHTGLVGGATSLPDVQFTGVQLANRVDTIDFAAAMNWWRIAAIRNETGGTLNITYSAPDCLPGQTPTPHTNIRRCYPVIWTPEGYPDPVTDWFHKYVVTTIYETDHTGGTPPAGSPRVVYQYQYFDGAAWHYSDDDGLIDAADKTWSDYRGYGRVGVTVGDPGEQTYTETRYFRGMHADKASPSGGTRTVTIDGINDEDWYAGTVRETITFNGPGGAVISRQTNDPWPSPATATRTINGDTVTARFSRVATTRTYTTLDAGRGERVTKTTTEFDSYGMPVAVDDFGEDGATGDEQCTKTSYEPRNTTTWLLDRAHRVQRYAVACADTAGSLGDDDVIGETRTWYDEHTFQTAPTRGLPTRTEEMSAWNAGAPSFTTVARAAYDTHGRATTSWDAMDKATTTAYTPATGGPVTATTVTNPLLHTTTTILEPAWGSPTSVVDPNGKRTDLTYDGLGRLTAVWLPGRDKTTQTANATYSYLVRTDAVTAVSTSKLNAAGAYVTSHALFDGLLRARQTQAPSPSGGRLLTDTFYDSAGRQVKTYGAYHAAGAAGTTLVTATQPTDVPNQTRTVYDGAGRITASIFQPYAAERWRTFTYYAGDRTDVTPPGGGTATSTVVDARGRTTALRQYHGPAPTPGTPGSWDTTTYTYNRKGHLAAVADPAGNDWTYTYDIRGRQTIIDDPDKGVTTFTFDNARRITTSTDARGKKLAYLYDPLGRKRALYDNQIGGTLRAQWVYDTIAKGQLSQTTRYLSTGTYQIKVTGYTDTYQPTGTQYVIPTSETGLGGTYNFFHTYNIDGSLASTSLPSTGGDLPLETLYFGYNNLGMPTTLNTLYGTSNFSYVPATAYNALGQIEQITLDTDDLAGGRVWQAYTRELETGRLTGIRTDRDSQTPNTLTDLRYTYDPSGTITKTVDVAPNPVDDTQCFTHDHLRRLTQAWTPTTGDCTIAPTVTALGGPAPYWHTWTHDNVGNRLTQTIHTATADHTTTYHYPPAGTAQPHALTSTSGATTGSYTYDPAGNTLTRPTPTTGTQTLTWNPEGHLETSTDTTTYIYDADGNRLIRRDPTGKTLYLPGQEIRYTTATAITTCTRYYTHAGTLIASRTSGGLTWLAGDHQGTAQTAITATTQAATTRRQTPYGTPRGTTPAWPNDKGFVGGTNDNTGLTHLGAREYDPTIGRFISVDPIMDLADPQQWHAYTYANNNPVTFSDPTGLLSNYCGPDGILCGINAGYDACAGGCNPGEPLPISKSNIGKLVVTTWSDETTTINGYTLPPGAPDLGVLLPEMLKRKDFGLHPGDDEIDADEVAMIILDVCAKLTGSNSIDCNNDFHQQVLADYWLPRMPEAWAAELGAGLGPGFRLRPGMRISGRPCGLRSFSGDTPVLMADGTTKPIQDIQPGDQVLATDPETGEQGPRTVTHLWVHDDTLVDLTLDGGYTITTTEDHPYWNATDQQWQQAQQLDRGDFLLTSTGKQLPVIGIDWNTNHTATAYNLTVDDIHTYYVLAGNTPVLVHNTGGPYGPSAGAAGTQMLIDDLLSRGYVIRGTEISMTAANGVNVRFDVVAEKNSVLSVYDAKNGPTAGFTKNQGARGGYMSIETHGGTFYGPNAQKAGLAGTTLGPTRVNIAGFGGYPHC